MPSFRRRASVIDADRVDEPKQEPDRPADAAEARIIGRVVLVRPLAVEHAARAELLPEGRFFRVVDVSGSSSALRW
mgnify:CR=1 FL=1